MYLVGREPVKKIKNKSVENDPVLEFTTLNTQFRISNDVCRQAARARRPRGRAAERMLFVRFKVGGS